MMSGTSVDGIDCALVDFRSDGPTLHARVLGFVERPHDDDLRSATLAVLPPASSDVQRWCELDARHGRAHAEAAVAALESLGGADLISMHGQTLFHWVVDGAARGSLQVGNPAWVAEATRLPVVSDLRSADVAAGGQGAPLASTLDALWLGDEPTAVLNLGGIANVTFVGDGPIHAGDTGPGNCLLDALAQRDFGASRDDGGGIAASGTVDEVALTRLLADPYLARPFPKSTGREVFHLGWVESLIGSDVRGADLMATLTEFTACTVAEAMRAQPNVRRIVASGGGTRNPFLMGRLAARTGITVVTSDCLGIPSQAKEAVLFALLGWLSVHGLPGVVDAVTGARRPAVLGSLTPPHGLVVGETGAITRIVVDPG